MAQVDGDGFERQRLAIENYARASGYEVVRWFKENGVSGKAEWADRPAWLEMIEATNGVRTILIERLDRLARRVLVQELIVRDLEKRGIRVVTASGEDTSDEDPERVLMRQILSVFAEYERKMIVLKLRGARQRKKAATGRCEGRDPYGKRNDERHVMGMIESLTGRGINPTDVSRQLNEAGYRTRYGKPWRPWTVNRIVRQIGAKYEKSA